MYLQVSACIACMRRYLLVLHVYEGITGMYRYDIMCRMCMYLHVLRVCVGMSIFVGIACM